MPSGRLRVQFGTARPAPRRAQFLPWVVVLVVAASGALAYPWQLESQVSGGGEGMGEVVGTVLDADSLPLPGATVLLVDATGLAVRGGETGATGYFRIRDVRPGAYLVRAFRLGSSQEEQAIQVEDGEVVELSFRLGTEALTLEGITVEGEMDANRIRFLREAGVTSFELAGGELKLIPGLAESDPLRAVEVLPGVVSVSDFSAAFNVRGGSADQNLILLDGVPLFNPFHLGGIFSVFNGDMVAAAQLQSGGFPPRYGGRVSSVLNVESDAGPGLFRVDAGISLLATRVAVAGSLPQGVTERLGFRRANWRVSGRRSYVDILAKPAFDFPYHLQDLQGVFDGWTPGGGRLLVTGYTGKDVLNLTTLESEDFPLRIFWEWGNDALGARWILPRARGGTWELRTSVSRFQTGLRFPDFGDSDFSSSIRQATVAAEMVKPLPGRWTFRWGGSGESYRYANRAETGGTVFQKGDGQGWLLGGFLQAEWLPARDWILEGGVRLDGWVPREGEETLVPSPRLSMKRFVGGGEGAVKLSAGRYSQFLHSLRDEELPLGLDIWILAGNRAPHVVSDQLQLGVEGFVARDWFVSLEGYLRTFDGVVTNNLANDPNDPLDDFLAGDGYSRGVDLFVRRSGEGVTGNLAVSWLQTERTFPDFLTGRDPSPSLTYPPVFDRRLGGDLVLRIPLPGTWNGGVRWSVGSGLPYTRALASYPYFGPRNSLGGRLLWLGASEEGEEAEEDEGQFGVLLAPRNSQRFPVYHRLDVSLRRSFSPSWGMISPYLDILNVYNQRNVLFYFYQFDADPPVRSGFSMFPILPTVGVEVRF
ncbi:MAG: TonB-dependent receptor [Gemmatimonadota bacterium]